MLISSRNTLTVTPWNNVSPKSKQSTSHIKLIITMESTFFISHSCVSFVFLAVGDQTSNSLVLNHCGHTDGKSGFCCAVNWGSWLLGIVQQLQHSSSGGSFFCTFSLRVVGDCMWVWFPRVPGPLEELHYLLPLTPLQDMFLVLVLFFDSS